MLKKTSVYLIGLIVFQLFAPWGTIDAQIVSSSVYTTSWSQHTATPARRAESKGAAFRPSVFPIVLAGGSLLSWGLREDMKGLRNQFFPGFHHQFDDYLQYAPAALTFSLKAAGIKGKYPMKRTLVSFAFSSAIMAAMINSLKYTTRVVRPDGSASNSFPSGHTANAFMNASLLHYEYGDRSFLYSLSGYALSTATALGRQVNNRHWVSDVLAGAAIGIFSAEVGNFLANKCMGGNNPNSIIRDDRDGSYLYPRYLTIRMGYGLPVQPYFDNDAYMKGGVDAGIEGGWFFGKYAGIGAEIGYHSFSAAADSGYVPTRSPKIAAALGRPLAAKYFRMGPVFRLPLYEGWMVGGKVMAGTLSGPVNSLSSGLHFTQRSRNSISWNAEGYVLKKLNSRMGVKSYVAYSVTNKSLSISVGGNSASDVTREIQAFRVMTAGIGVSVFF